jgi:hypothetical protein
MGEDWIRKTEKSYRRSVQKAIGERLLPKPLLISEEKSTKTYPCAILPGNLIPCVGMKLMLHKAESGEVVALHEHRVVGSIGGDPQKDVSSVFDENPELCAIVEVVVADSDADTRHVELAITQIELAKRQ